MAIRNVATVYLAAASGLIAASVLAADLTPTNVILASSPNFSIFGQAVVFSASVSPPLSSGRVTFYDGVTILGNSALANGHASLSTILLASGTRSIRAFYGGDATHGASTSEAFTQNVNTVPADSFGPGAVYPGSAFPTAVAVGDFNSDGKMDLAIGNGSSPASLSIRLGNGDGTFQAPVDYPAGSYGAPSIAVGDFNGDGNLDLAVAEILPYATTADGSAIAIFLGNGDGTFQPGVNYATGAVPLSVVSGDFNGDGIADLATANRNDGTISLLLGNGDGTFQKRVDYPAGAEPYAIIAGDFNDDGKADLAVVNFDSFNIFLGNGDGSFQPKISYQTAGGSSVIAADFNGDGNADLAISGYPGMRVYLGDGRGGFQSTWSYDSGSYLSLYLAVCDFNNDGKLDLAFVTSAGEAALLPGHGDGTFEVPKSVPNGIGINYSGSIAVADFNGDGKADLVAANGSSVSVFVGRVGLTSFTTFTSSPNPSRYGQNVQFRATVSPPTTTGTVTFYDGTTSLGTSPLTNNQAELTINQLKPGPHPLTAVYSGDAAYFSSTSPVLVQTVNPAPVTITLSSSANPALLGQSVILIASVAQADATGTVEFREGPQSLGTRPINGQTAFLATSSFSGGPHLITATYSGDANYEAGASQVLTQVIATGAAITTTLSSSATRSTLGQSVTFTAKVSPVVPGMITFYDGVTVLGTMTVDGGQASLTTNLLPVGKRSIRAYYSGSVAYGPSSSPVIAITVSAQPVNRLQAPATVLSGPGIGAGFSFVIGDFNKDGKLDLAAVTATGVAVTLGNGDGSFQTAVNFATDAFPRDVTTGDFNGDGKTDLAVTTSSGTVSVLLGNGDGSFQRFVSYNGGPNPGAVVAADVNGDGFADLAIDTGYVLLGKGDGTFQNAVRWLNGGYLAVGDFNGDGKIDFIDSSGVVQVGHGDGTFDARARLNVVPATYIQVFTSIADIDGDGKADVIAIVHAADMGGHGVQPNFRDTLSVYLGQGDGTFRPPLTVATGAAGQFPGAIAVGDFNGDGNMDLALVNQGTVNVFPGNGDGSFGAEFPFTIDAAQSSLNTTKVLLGDFNGDGRTDMTFAGRGLIVQLGQLLPASTTNLLSSPNPSMYGQSVTLTATVGPPTATGVVTFYEGASLTPLGTKTLQNGQASIDPGLLALGTHSFRALYGGDANFPASFSTAIHNVITATPSVTLTSSANPALSGENVFLTATVSNRAATGTIVFRDGPTTLATRIMSDGKALLAVSDLPAGSHSLTASYSGDANNAASVSSALLQTITPGNSSAVELTSSGNPASYGRSVTLLASVSPPDATGTVAFYDGVAMLGSTTLSAGQASLTTTLLESGTRQIRAYYAGDAAHVPASRTLSQTVRAEPANGFAEIGQAVTTGYGYIVTGDFNGDGKPDLIITGTRLNLLLGNGDGTFQPPVDIGVGDARDSSVRTADFNGDGKTDLVFSYRTGSGVSVLLGKGDGTFERPVFYASFGWPTTVVTGDFNGDGKADIAIFSYTNRYSLRILLGNGDGSFEPLITSSLEFFPRAVVVGDFNGDGKADFAIPIVNTQTVAILIGNGDGTFQTPATYDTGSSAIDIVLGDFNGDGRSDLGVATDDGTVAILLGNGDGTFRSAGNYRAGAQHYISSMSVADFNGDGYADLAVSTSLGIGVLAGNGDGTFQKPIYLGYSSLSLAVADFNGDGKSDFAIGSLSVFLGAVTNVPSIALAGALNAAAMGDATHFYRHGAQVSPGGLATVFGNFLQSAEVSVQLGGGLAAPVLAASPGQVTFQVPWELAGQAQSTVAVTVNGQTSGVQPMKLEPLTPGIFTINGAGFGQGAIYDLSNRLVDSANPATARSVVQIYCTGLGEVSYRPATGAPAEDQRSMTTNIPVVSIGNENLQVLFSGLAPGLIGVNQLNVVLPQAIPAYIRGPAVPVSISFENIRSNTVTMAVQ